MTLKETFNRAVKRIGGMLEEHEKTKPQRQKQKLEELDYEIKLEKKKQELKQLRKKDEEKNNIFEV